MATREESALASLDPDETARQVVRLGAKGRRQAEQLYMLIQSGPVDREALSDSVVALDATVSQLQELGDWGLSMAAGLRNALAKAVEQRDEAIDHAVSVQAEVDERIAKEREEAVEQAEQEFIEHLDWDEVDERLEQDLSDGIEARCKYLRIEGQIDVADRLEQAYGAYCQSRDAMQDLRIGVDAMLIELSNKRRAESGQEEIGLYTLPDDYEDDLIEGIEELEVFEGEDFDDDDDEDEAFED